MLEVVTALAAEEAHSTSSHSRAASSPRDAQSTPAQSAAQDSSLQGTASFHGTADLQGTAEPQDTAEAQGTDAVQGAADIPKSPNDYTPTDASQTSGGDEGLLDLYALNREGRASGQTSRKKQRMKVSSVKLGRNNDEGNLSDHDNDDEGFDATITPDFERKSEEALERKSNETEQVNIEEEKDASNVKSGDTEELDLEEFQSTAR
ncbi:hypothetical protein Tco_0136281 [Tanacetum coccineum]